ncbi:unnamed protein product [marine sediment metagenome]|uniref:Uncharacterized protein n=1 Tax=marine sediment metagenome TaxID=412755 RepID=X1NMY2_9ZZZZ
MGESGCSVCPDHYDCVYEVGPDEDTTMVSGWYQEEYRRELYNIEDSGIGTGAINKITLHFRVKAASAAEVCAKGVIKSGETVNETTEKKSRFGLWD